ncbi:MAG: hypothetical protein IT370_13935 [Deltaproteobacteria bacterium]|nr:hypothetical protein [Deltaproteobacteria bacterium]
MIGSRVIVSFALATTLLAGACASEPEPEDGLPPLVGTPAEEPGFAAATADPGKADWFGTSPETWRRFWYWKYYGQVSAPLESLPQSPPFNGTRTVLLIPGTTIGAEFFVPMANRLRRDGFDPVIWAPSDLFTDSLEVGAQRISAQVQRVLASRGITKLHLVAQCDAGVAARYYAQLLGGNRAIDQLVTFVSAHHGSSAAPIAGWWTGWPALADIKPGSSFMQRLNAAPLPAGLRFTSIYSCRDEYMWPQTTSRVPGATNVEFCNHAIGHFDPFWDRPVYERILLTLRGQGATAPTSY